MRILETQRLVLRRLTEDDADFILELVNVPEFHRFVGDRGVRTVPDARRYLRDRLVEGYRRFGFGSWLVELKSSGEAAGICGFVRRDELEAPDIGFAFLPRFWSRGYAFESSVAAFAYGRETLAMDKIVAIVSPGNERSIRLLKRLGMTFERTIRLAEDDDDAWLFASALSSNHDD